jgi:TusA-related sulfurtransferase
MSSAPRVIDGRDLECPRPLQDTLAALPSLLPGETLRLLLYREPFPLYPLLEARGFAHRAARYEDGTFEIEIRHA